MAIEPLLDLGALDDREDNEPDHHKEDRQQDDDRGPPESGRLYVDLPIDGILRGPGVLLVTVGKLAVTHDRLVGRVIGSHRQVARANSPVLLEGRLIDLRGLQLDVSVAHLRERLVELLSRIRARRVLQMDGIALGGLLSLPARKVLGEELLE